jgi:hypothetical protein
VWICGQAGLRACRAEVVFTHGWTSHHALPIHGEPNMQDGADMNHRFLALTSATQHTLRYLAEQGIRQVWITSHFGGGSELPILRLRLKHVAVVLVSCEPD